ncbi:hypothetical protein FRC07_001697 [Ceratobasidium sp. 392]|nr:hypothetical protein FRC07_001697 [Ceratobasidium sp. 392]
MEYLAQPSGRRRTRQSTLQIPSNLTKEPTSQTDESAVCYLTLAYYILGVDQWQFAATNEGEAPVRPTGQQNTRVHFEVNEDNRHDGGPHQPQAKLPIGTKQTAMGTGVLEAPAAPTIQDAILEDFKNSSKLQGYAPIWNQYVKMAEEEDGDLVEDWDR